MRVVFIVLLVIILPNSLFSQVDTTIYSFDGKNLFQGQVLDGRKTGFWKELTSSGEIINTIEIIDSKGKCKITPDFKDSNYTGYYYGIFIGNKIILHGKYELTNGKTNIFNVGHYKYGKKVGQWRTYKNDILIKLDFYKENEETFKSHVFNESGLIIYISNFNNNGLQEGEFVGFDNLGRISELGNFQNGCKVGEWSYFKENKLYCKGEFFPDYLHLKSVKDTLYIVNKHDSLAQEIYSDEVIKSFDLNEQILYIKHGKWVYFNSEGEIFKTENYEKGRLVLGRKKKPNKLFVKKNF